MKKILVPTDFSKTASVALDSAFDIAKKSGADLIVLHVVEEVTNGSFNVEADVIYDNSEDRLFTFKLIEKAKKQLEKLVLDPKYADVKLDGELRVGNAFHGIQTIITEHKVDLIVMGSAGHSKLEEMIIGTNTEKIVRTSRCPVLTVNKKPATTEFKNIVYATALAPDEEVFSRIVKKTQKIYDSTIHLVRINTPGDFQRDFEVKNAMTKFAKTLGLKNYTVNIFNDYSVEEGVIRFADEVNADLIAMATHGRTGFAHVIAGSVAEDVVKHAKRPVLTFVVKH
ncbi:MAG: universal stress protein [Azospira oryzae]|jgi:nucleotide-binding universal stress UspA family protein|nr:MAG: universal stress protein [Azospira oryzae]